MDWFLKLEPQVQIWVLVVAGVTIMWVVKDVLGFLKSVIVKSPPPLDDWFTEYGKRMPKVNDGPFHTRTYRVETRPKPAGPSAETKPKPPQGGSGTAPTLTVALYYIGRDDGMFYSYEPAMWVPKCDAATWTDLPAARNKAAELLASGHQIRLVTEERTK